MKHAIGQAHPLHYVFISYTVQRAITQGCQKQRGKGQTVVTEYVLQLHII